jgi:TM2 domain-containing membrane protein YozV
MYTDRSRQPPPKSLLIAYVLWLFLGIFGGHRFYLRKSFTGFLYAISFGLYFVGWGIDLLLLPFMVRRVNERLQQEARQQREARFKRLNDSRSASEVLEVERVEIPEEVIPVEADEPEMPEWARRRSSVRPVEWLLRLAFFVVAPCFIAVSAIMFGYVHLLVLIVVTLVVFGFIGRLDLLLKNYPMLKEIPMLSRTLDSLQSFTNFYRKQAPYHFAYYLVYPLVCVPALCLSSAARDELKQFARLLGGLIAVMVLPIGYSYFDVYPPHLGFEHAFVYIFTHAVMIALIVVLFVLPTMTTALTLNVTRARRQLRFFIGIGLISGLPVGLAYWFTIQTPVSFMAEQLLNERLTMKSFRDELTVSDQMFLRYWGEHLDQLSRTLPEAPEVNEELTTKLQRHLGGIVIKNEIKAFQIVAWRDPGSDLTWQAVCIRGSSNDLAPRLLHVANSAGQFYDHWQSLPAEVKDRFEIRVQIPEFGIRFAVFDAKLLGDWPRPR